MKSLYWLMVCFLILTACSSGKAANSGTVQEHDHKPSLNVALNVSGNQVSVKVDTDMHISAEHAGLARKEGEGHIHMYLDNGEKIIVKQGEQVFNDLAPGKHTLKISLHNNDHTPYDVTKTEDFEIK